MRLILWNFCFFASVSITYSLVFRSALSQDVEWVRQTLFSEKMNPFSISADRLVVALSDDDEPVGFGQLKPLDDETKALASVFVRPENRRQGIARELIAYLLRNEEDSRLCLVTLRPTMRLYESFGFRETTDVARLPKAMQIEYFIGSAVSVLLGNDLVAMTRDSDKGNMNYDLR